MIDRAPLARNADFHFRARSLGFLPCLFEVVQRHGSAVRTVFGFAATYNVAAAGLCLAGAMNPLLAAILMPLSSVFSLGLVRWRMQRKI